MTLTRAGWYTYVSLTKTFFNDRLSLQVAGHNLLNDHQRILINYGTRSMHIDQHNDSRKFEVTVRYKFNTTDSKWRGSGAGAEERSRLGK